MNNDHDYIRLTKIWERSSSAAAALQDALTHVPPEGAFGHRLGLGYIIDGWFLANPTVGRPMMVLRFRRNGLCNLGLFTSSLILNVSEAEIRTENSIYKVERRWFETETCHIEH
ncbi:hypothetical protein ESB00_17830 [Oleiharenicola lentus]|uniref:Uncharacterized protein n=1 Tax=Oleiharenicola lentus TaxID=2508720 RepID=A0A4Q1C585_9BACT|nr:hypothetical protein [Oleiharenicola lentus]RXK53551.1 hypothetical protein ESB00_17830 [Oleiharenicola lentus]